MVHDKHEVLRTFQQHAQFQTGIINNNLQINKYKMSSNRGVKPKKFTMEFRN